LTAPDSAEARKAAALEALRTERRPRTFWEMHGGRIGIVAAAILALLGIALVGKFLRTSRDEVSRSEEELRRGMRSK
jgi:hypothetical protein